MTPRVAYINNCNLTSKTGDGVVGYHELSVLKAIYSDVVTIDSSKLPHGDVWLQDYVCSTLLNDIEIAHFYGGPYGASVRKVHKSIVTMPAHNRHLSIEEHEMMFGSGSYPYMHVKDNYFWKMYTEHVRLANVVIAPSTHAKENIIRDMDVSESKVVVISHGCDIPEKIEPIPDRFNVGYMSQFGPDKGLIYLIQAWSDLNYNDSELVLAGAGTDSEFVISLINKFARNSKSKFRLLGRVSNPSDVYNYCSAMVAPSVTEGCGITILEALAHGRPVITTKNCVGGDVVNNNVNGNIVSIRNAHEISKCIRVLKTDRAVLKEMSNNAVKSVADYTWDKIEKRYEEVYIS